MRRYGSLDKYSAFRFESYLFQIKKEVRKGARPLQQLAKIYVKGLSSCPNPPGSDKFKGQHTNGPFDKISLDSLKCQYSVYKGEHIFINIKEAKDNTFILKDGSFVVVENIIQLNNDDIAIVGCNKPVLGSVYSLQTVE